LVRVGFGAVDVLGFRIERLLLFRVNGLLMMISPGRVGVLLAALGKSRPERGKSRATTGALAEAVY
jgi:hypothetical protein